jgi:hypothetical protein
MSALAAVLHITRVLCPWHAANESTLKARAATVNSAS